MPTRVHPLAAAVGALATAYFALWACAPVAMLRPPVPMPEDARHEITLGGGWNEPMGEPTSFSGSGSAWSAQLAYGYHFKGDHIVLGGTLFGGQASLVGGGFLFRVNAVQKERFRLAFDVNAGFLWGELAVPLGFRLADRVWLYTAPGGGLRMAQAVSVPVGVSFGLGEDILLSPELAVGYGAVGADLLGAWTGLQVSGSLGFTGRF